jgi:hypothetical protein
LGLLNLQVEVGQEIGCPGPAQDGSSNGEFELGVLASGQGAIADPSYILDSMRDFVNEWDQVEAYLALVPPTWPLFENDRQACLEATESTLYPNCVLEDLRRRHEPTREEWRTVGKHQKALYRKRLLARTGHLLPSEQAPHFDFNSRDAANLFQLEAIIEFYANFDDPWALGAEPRNPGHSKYHTVDLLDPEGVDASISGTVVTLDAGTDLSRVHTSSDASSGPRERGDVIVLADNPDLLNASYYRIADADVSAGTVTLDTTSPAFGAGTKLYWQLWHRPTLILIDSFGGRVRGDFAKVVSGKANTIRLERAADLQKVNGRFRTNAAGDVVWETIGHFDTIYLPGDSARAGRTYRIIRANSANKEVELDDQPDFGGGSSAWHIPAGLSGDLPVLAYNLGRVRQANRAPGWNHYDGVMFVVYRGVVHSTCYRWSSYTSRSATGGQLSSIRGNRPYVFRSHRSGGKKSINYSFQVVDPGQDDTVAEARYYFRTEVVADTDGKQLIRIHDGFLGPEPKVHTDTGSHGCLVSRNIFSMRDVLIEYYQREHRLLTGEEDAEVAKVYGLGRAQSRQLWSDNTASGLRPEDWRNKIVGTLWLIRPDERPIG